MNGNLPEQSDSEHGTLRFVEPPPIWPAVRHPFQVSAFGVFLTLGAGWLLQGPSVALGQLLGEPWVMLWPPALVVSGACGLISALYAQRDEGLSLLTERVALIGVGGFCAIYILALVGDMGMKPWVTEVLFAFILWACGWRLRQVRKRIKWLLRHGGSTAPRWRP